MDAAGRMTPPLSPRFDRLRQRRVDADIAMWAMGRGARISAGSDQEAKAAHGAPAIRAGNFELTPKRGNDHGAAEYGQNEPEDEYPGYGAER